MRNLENLSELMTHWENLPGYQKHKTISNIKLVTTQIDETGKLNLESSIDPGFGEATQETHKSLEDSIINNEKGRVDNIEGI